MIKLDKRFELCKRNRKKRDGDRKKDWQTPREGVYYGIYNENNAI